MDLSNFLRQATQNLRRFDLDESRRGGPLYTSFVLQSESSKTGFDYFTLLDVVLDFLQAFLLIWAAKKCFKTIEATTEEEKGTEAEKGTEKEKGEQESSHPHHPSFPVSRCKKCEYKIQVISYWHKVLSEKFDVHLDNLHSTILNHPNLSDKQKWLNIDRHWSAASAVSRLSEITWRLGTGPGRPRTIKDSELTHELVFSYLHGLQALIKQVLKTLRAIEKDLSAADAKQS